MKYDWLDSYCMSKLKVQKDFKQEWNATRYLIGDKMFALWGHDADEKEIISLKLEPIFGDFLRKLYKDVMPGYYLNKEHWNSVFLDGELPDDVLKDMIDKSYSIVFNSLTKKVRAGITG